MYTLCSHYKANSHLTEAKKKKIFWILEDCHMPSPNHNSLLPTKLAAILIFIVNTSLLLFFMFLS